MARELARKFALLHQLRPTSWPLRASQILVIPALVAALALGGAGLAAATGSTGAAFTGSAICNCSAAPYPGIDLAGCGRKNTHLTGADLTDVIWEGTVCPTARTATTTGIRASATWPDNTQPAASERSLLLAGGVASAPGGMLSLPSKIRRSKVLDTASSEATSPPTRD
jgi:hypothetical protein